MRIQISLHKDKPLVFQQIPLFILVHASISNGQTKHWKEPGPGLYPFLWGDYEKKTIRIYSISRYWEKLKNKIGKSLYCSREDEAMRDWGTERKAHTEHGSDVQTVRCEVVQGTLDATLSKQTQGGLAVTFQTGTRGPVN